MKEMKSLLASRVPPKNYDITAGALASGIALVRMISNPEIKSSTRGDAMERLEEIMDFLLRNSWDIPDAILERHGIKKDAQGKIEWRGGQ